MQPVDVDGAARRRRAAATARRGLSEFEPVRCSDWTTGLLAALSLTPLEERQPQHAPLKPSRPNPPPDHS